MKTNLVTSKLLTSSFLVLVILFVCINSIKVHANNNIESVRLWSAPSSTRVVFDLKDKPDYSFFSLRSPNRLVIDFSNSRAQIDFKKLARSDHRVKKIRTSKPKNKKSKRVVLELDGTYKLVVFPLAPTGQYGHRLVVEMHDTAKPKSVVKNKKVDENRDVVIAIVAGHGGDDPGSIGYNGSYEKHVTLAIAKKLAAQLNRQHGLKAVLIRTGDYFVRHERKPRMARENKADLLISIHADAFTSSQPNGASVLVQSARRANSEFTKVIANREKESQLLGGAGEIIKTTQDDNLAVILADMTKEFTTQSSYVFATEALKELKKVTKLHKTKPVGLSLAVLTAQDIPSVLIETGFISNPKDEKNLNNPAHQKKLAVAITGAIKNYFTRYPPKGTLLASKNAPVHSVVNGESLSLIAQRYNVSLSALKQKNGLKSNTIHVGQKLMIPQ
ncbi:N-acetylmuramoyl-L-alanine amidase [Pseudoalteromonas umbrosa]|uniref:N-acetylmuramoyl-L-alanine amidase n=1 Tax=Pseudoalteromonas umbrosa TaxID=3048489 RepID=UPI0024C3255F|nr:N-acetylmuramoyl-L-alanine amidase [Pseudoalteromonas sp. B95]MDK1288443.1 N-acetylmuramoyl-L-alanine amidase [Pseudoalteromonas sp. B95]